MSWLEVVAVGMRFAGLLAIVPGLWLAANGARVVVSGRLDERRQATTALKRSVPLIAVGILLLVAASWVNA